MSPDLDAIKRRCAEATEDHPLRDGRIWSRREFGNDGCQIHTRTLMHVAMVRRVADAEFIAHARTDIPALLAEVERLKAALAVQRDLVERSHMFAAFCRCESGEVKQRAIHWLADYNASRTTESRPS